MFPLVLNVMLFAFYLPFIAPSYPQASVVHTQPSMGVVTFPEEQTPVVHPSHVIEPQQYDERHPSLRNIPLTQRLSQEDISER